MSQEIRLAIRIPKDLLDSIDQYIQNNRKEGSIETRIPETQPGKVDTELGFDPITGSAIVWVAFKFAGETALTVAVGLLTNAIYDWLKKRNETGMEYQMPIRFPNGKEIVIHSNQPLDSQELEALIRQNAQP
jgi:hypothetical protein